MFSMRRVFSLSEPSHQTTFSGFVRDAVSSTHFFRAWFTAILGVGLYARSKTSPLTGLQSGRQSSAARSKGIMNEVPRPLGKGGISRRGFLKTAGIGVAATSLLDEKHGGVRIQDGPPVLKGET